MPRAIIHIGVPKTGTTSFQTWATENREELRRTTGLRYYRSVFPDRIPATGHWEFEVMCIRPERHSLAREFMSSAGRLDLPERLRINLARELNGEDLLISSEGLSNIRFPDEVDRLRQLLVGYDLEFVAVRRDPADFLRSCRAWMANNLFEPSTDPQSTFYVEPDSWLADFDALDPVFPGLRWVEYEAAMQSYGSIIPAICDEIGLDIDSLPNWRIPAQNRSRGVRARANKMRRRLNRRKRQLRHRVRQLRHGSHRLLRRS